MTLAFEISNLKKTYRSKITNQQKTALGGINLDIEQGSFFGLLGPNGAGKSTMINIIAGLVIKTSGRVLVNGFDLDNDPINLKKSIGIVPQEVVIDPFFNVRQCLEYYAGYFGVRKKDRRTDEILNALNLTDKADFNPRRLSGGMKRRLLIAKALVHNPQILILDEPTAGVDVELRTQLWDYVKELNRKGTTILLTTHYLEEAQELCDKIAIINHGKIIANDTKNNLLKNFGTKNIVLEFSDKISQIPSQILNFDPQISESGNIIKFTPKNDTHNIGEIVAGIQASGLNITNISTEEADLEDIFKKLVSG
ncbi:MAG TPA: multidrug ABC transporter ATP-binding protein [Alphaproteobacteria bacterium]|nr:multidrug ABC transporter ATP-binding protein [Alphaproteobacteria bacterium]